MNRMTAEIYKYDLAEIIAGLITQGVNFDVKMVSGSDMYLITFTGGY